MIPLLGYGIITLSLVLMAVSGWYAYRDRLIDDRLLALAALIEVGLLVQLVRGLVGVGEIADGDEKATFAAYLVSLPVVPVGTAFLAIKEKTRWAMGAIVVGALTVAVMTVRVQQIWALRG